MQAVIKSPSSVVLRSKTIIQDSCRCQGWKNQRPIFTPCPLTSSRFLSSIPRCLSTGNLFIHQYHSNHLRRSPAVVVLDPFYKQGIVLFRDFSISQSYSDKEPLKPSSKLEETVIAIKEKEKEKEEAKGKPAAVATPPPPKKSLGQKIWHELVHYYHGFRLLFIDINVSRKLLWRVLNGKSLSRREHRLLVRTVGDIFRLIPFSVFIIVPFMEFLLPLAIKFFPGMLPSTFQTATEREDKLKQALKVRLEMAKFLQTTLDDMSVQSKHKDSEAAQSFTEFFKKIKTSGEVPSNEEIIKFSTIFEDEITLDSLSRQQLTALCRVLDINPMGTTNLLRFQIRMRLRSLAADDKMIMKEGIDSLTIQELQTACQARAMRAYGVSEEKLRTQLSQWLELSVNEKVPPSLLLLSRALMLPDTITPSDQLKATISALPDTVELKAKAALSEREGVLDNKTKIELIKEEEKRIQEERAEQREEDKRLIQEKAEELVDTAPIIKSDTATPDIEKLAEKKEKAEEISSKDLEALEDALDTLGKEKKKLLVEKEELDELKEELQEYQEDVKELKQVLATGDTKADISETKAAKNLFKKVNSMISKMDIVLSDLENKGQKLKTAEETIADDKKDELVKIDELMDVIKRIQKVPDETRLAQISKVLGKIDDDHDGAISVDEVLKVIELIGKEHVHLNTKQLDEIIELLEKEEALELEEQIEKALEKQAPVEKIATSTKDSEKGDSSSRDGEEKKKGGGGEPPSSSEQPKKAAISVSPNGKGSKTITEPKDINNGTSKKL